MTNKPKIQYVGQFYVHGSEAQAVAHQTQRRRARTQLPQMRREKVEKIYVDPVALAGIGVAVLLLVVMVMGALRIHTAWGQYEQMKDRVYDLRQENLVLSHQYRSTYDLTEIRTKAEAMGMIPKEEAKTITVRVTVPEPAPEVTWLDDLKWFLEGLLE